MATAVVTHERGSSYITNIAGSKTCYGLVGTLTLGGLCFDTLERFALDGLDFVHLAAQDHATAVMYWHAKLGRILNPLNGKGRNKQYNNILVHRGEQPSWFEGCTGPGVLRRNCKTDTLTGGAEAMAKIWEYCGGKPGDKTGWTAKALPVLFRVANAFPDRSTLAPRSTN